MAAESRAHLNDLFGCCRDLVIRMHELQRKHDREVATSWFTRKYKNSTAKYPDRMVAKRDRMCSTSS